MKYRFLQKLGEIQNQTCTLKVKLFQLLGHFYCWVLLLSDSAHLEVCILKAGPQSGIILWYKVTGHSTYFLFLFSYQLTGGFDHSNQGFQIIVEVECTNGQKMNTSVCCVCALSYYLANMGREVPEIKIPCSVGGFKRQTPSDVHFWKPY